MKLLIVEDNQQECLQFQQYLEEKPEIDLVGISDSAVEALKLAEEMKPDAVILDLELQEGSGLEFLEQLQIKSLERAPFVLVTTATTHATTLQFVREKGSGFILTKNIRNYSPQFAIDQLLHLKKYLSPASYPASAGYPYELIPARSLREQIEDKLAKMGIVTGTGCGYLVEAAWYCVHHPSRRIVLKRNVYPHVIRTFQARTENPEEKKRINDESIERDIRTVLEKAWLVGDPDDLKKHYTQAIQPGKGNPTVLEMVTYLTRCFSRK